jgi:hypothetical protein
MADRSEEGTNTRRTRVCPGQRQKRVDGGKSTQIWASGHTGQLSERFCQVGKAIEVLARHLEETEDSSKFGDVGRRNQIFEGVEVLLSQSGSRFVAGEAKKIRRCETKLGLVGIGRDVVGSACL